MQQVPPETVAWLRDCDGVDNWYQVDSRFHRGLVLPYTFPHLRRNEYIDIFHLSLQARTDFEPGIPPCCSVPADKANLPRTTDRKPRCLQVDRNYCSSSRKVATVRSSAGTRKRTGSKCVIESKNDQGICQRHMHEEPQFDNGLKNILVIEIIFQLNLLCDLL